jgi:two-component system, LytTR family, sensor kinase
MTSTDAIGSQASPGRSLAALVLAFWTFVALLSAANLWVAAADRPLPQPLGASVVVAFLSAYLWAAITLLVFRLCATFPLEGEGWPRSLVVFAAAGLLVAVAVGVLVPAMRFWIAGPPGPPPGVAFPGGPPPAAGPRPFPGGPRLWFLDELITYAALVAAGLAREYFLRFQARQADAVRLQAQAERLNAQLAEARLSALRTQLDPHFLFNTLNAVSAMVERDPEGVQRMIARLSELLRYSLEGGQRQEVPLSEEIGLVQRYLEIMEVRFQGRLRVSMDVPVTLLAARVPSLVLQPLVENAIKHGVARRPGEGLIEITAHRGGDRLVLRVRDDGEPAAAPAGDGVGLSNTRERLRQLYGESQDLTVGPAPEGGFAAEVSIPYRVDG